MSRRTVYIETFGCQMNELDSELVIGQLRTLGYTFTPERDAADIVLYNTCSVREHAEQKVWSRLGEDKARKLRNPAMVVGVLGCMAERDGADLIRRMPVVDVMCGPGELDKLPSLLDNAMRTRLSQISDVGISDVDASGVDYISHPKSHIPNPPLPDHIPHPTSHFPLSLPPSARQIALQGNTSRRSGTLAAAQDTLELLDLSRAVSPDDHHGSAYVRITRGCNKFCTYCVVPFTRGAEVHRPPDTIVDECKRLADAGVIEVTLLGQTVNHYRFEHGAAVTIGGVVQPQKGRPWSKSDVGNWSKSEMGRRKSELKAERSGSGSPTSHLPLPTSYSTTTFADLLRRIHDEVPAIQRLRFVTSFPRDFGDDVLEVIRDHPRICRYLHVPAQTGSNRLLEKMNRGYTVEEYLEFLDRARARLHQPEIGRPLTIAGDIIVGFPTETEEDFAATQRLLTRARYKNCFIFKYSPRPGTIAHDKMPDDVPDDVKRRRNNALLALQQQISERVSAEFVGQTLDVFVQGVSKREARRRDRIAAGAGASGSVGLTIGGRAIRGDLGAAVLDTPPTAAPIADADPAAPVQLSARTDGDMIVFFDLPPGRAPDECIGKMIRVRIDRAAALALHGNAAAGRDSAASSAE